MLKKVVRSSDVPVLVIKNDHDDFSIDDIVFASDFKNDNKETYRQASEFAMAFGAQFTFTNGNTRLVISRPLKMQMIALMILSKVIALKTTQ